jgi:hypothetical protein
MSSAPIGPGDWVECVKVAPGNEHLIGSIYQISSVGDWRGQPWVNVCGVPKPWGRPGWHARCFRPIYRPDASFIASLKAPPKGQKTPEIAGADSRDDIPNLSPREVEVA